MYIIGLDWKTKTRNGYIQKNNIVVWFRYGVKCPRELSSPGKG